MAALLQETINVWPTQRRFISVFFSLKAIISNLTSFIAGNSAIIFLNVFFFAGTSPPGRRRFGRALSRPSTPNWSFDVCSQEARFGSTSGCVPEETHGNTSYDWKTTPSSKGNTDIFSFFSCFNCWMIFLCFRLTASVKWAFFQRLRGKENETDHENSKSDSADRST